jgi:hypothetical protein
MIIAVAGWTRCQSYSSAWFVGAVSFFFHSDSAAMRLVTRVAAKATKIATVVGAVSIFGGNAEPVEVIAGFFQWFFQWSIYARWDFSSGIFGASGVIAR